MVERLSAGKSHRNARVHKKVQHTFVRPRVARAAMAKQKLSDCRRRFIYSTRDDRTTVCMQTICNELINGKQWRRRDGGVAKNMGLKGSERGSPATPQVGFLYFGLLQLLLALTLQEKEKCRVDAGRKDTTRTYGVIFHRFIFQLIILKTSL